MKFIKKRRKKNPVSAETKLFIRIQIASMLGSAADYLITIILASGLNFFYLMANLSGNFLGGTVQFYLSRKWAFPSVAGSVDGQIFRFILVFIGGLMLSAAGVFLLTNYGGLHYVLSKTIVSVLLGVTYNYLLQKKFVFVSRN